MLILDTTTRSLKFDLGGVVTTNELPFVASYVDVAAPDTYEPAAAHGISAGAADIEILPAPSATRKRQLKFLSIYNRDTVAAVVRVFLLDGATERDIVKITLPAGSTLIYTDGEGFRVISSAGAIA